MRGSDLYSFVYRLPDVEARTFSAFTTLDHSVAYEAQNKKLEPLVEPPYIVLVIELNDSTVNLAGGTTGTAGVLACWAGSNQ